MFLHVLKTVFWFKLFYSTKLITINRGGLLDTTKKNY